MNESVEKNEMQVIAALSFWVTDAVAGRLGEWSIEERGWGEGDSARATEEVYFCLRSLKEAGFTDDSKTAERAPYTPNIKVGCYRKRFKDLGMRYVTIVYSDRFGLKADFKVYDYQPWPVY